MWGKINLYRLMVGKAEGKRPTGIRKSRWMDNINMYLGKIGL
jgi:hypothetical protein